MAKVSKLKFEDHKKVQRAWGFEVWICQNNEYWGKILHINKGKKTSLQYHLKKHEHMWLERGKVRIRMIDPVTAEEYYNDLEPGESVPLERGQIHQIIALEDSDITEFSSPHFEEDTYRVESNQK